MFSQTTVVLLFIALPLLFTLRLRHRALRQSPVAAAEYLRCARAFHGCTVVFWMAWLAWYHGAAPFASLAEGWPWLGRGLGLVPSAPAVLIGTAVTLAMRHLMYPVYARRPDTTYPRRAFLLQGLWLCGLLGTVLLAGGALTRWRAEPVGAVVAVMLAPVGVYVCWRLLLSASGIGFIAQKDGALRERVDRLAHGAGMPALRGLYLVKTPYQPLRNAFASTQGSLYLSEALLDQLTAREADAVVAHELTHLKHNHPRRFWGWFVVCAVAGGCLAWPLASRVTGVGGVAVCLLGFFAGAAVALGRSRGFEMEADLGAVAITGDPEAMISALVTLARKPEPPQGRRKKWRRPVTTHPSLQRRAEYIAEAGGVSPERVEALLAGETVGEEDGRD